MARSGLNGGSERAGRGPGRATGAVRTWARGPLTGALVEWGQQELRPGSLRMHFEQNPVAEHHRLVTVVLVDDEPLIRSALAQALAVGGLDLVGEAAEAQAAIRMVLDL